MNSNITEKKYCIKNKINVNRIVGKVNYKKYTMCALVLYKQDLRYDRVEQALIDDRRKKPRRSSLFCLISKLMNWASSTK